MSKLRSLGSLALLACALQGCAVLKFRAAEKDHEYSRVTTTYIFQFWDAKMRIDKLRGSSTDKTHGLTLGGFDDSVSSTNVAEVIGKAVEGAVRGLKP